MNPHELQRMSVRMLFDWSLTTAVYDAGTDPILGVAISSRARAALTKPPRERWRSDRYRQSRVVTGLLQSFVSASAWALALAPDRPLTEFFADEIFHRAVHRRTSAVNAFGEWLRTHFATPPPIAALATLEGALDSVRRSRRPSTAAPGTTWCLHPGADVVELPGGTSDLLHATLQRLEAHPISSAHAAVERAWDRAGIHETLDGTERLLIQRQAHGGADISRLSDALYELLAVIREGGRRAELLAVMEAHGASADDLEGLLQDLERDGLVVRAASVRDGAPSTRA